MGKRKKVLNIVTIRNLQYFGHMLQETSHTTADHTREVEDRKTRHGRHTPWLDDLETWSDCTTTDLFKGFNV